MICSPPVLAELPTTEMSLEWRARKVAIGLDDARGTIVYTDVNKPSTHREAPNERLQTKYPRCMMRSHDRLTRSIDERPRIAEHSPKRVADKTTIKIADQRRRLFPRFPTSFVVPQQ